MTPKIANQGPASAGPFRVAAAFVAVVMLAAAPACKVGHDRAKNDGGLDKDKSVKAQPLDPTATSVTAPGGSNSTVTTGRGTTTTKRTGTTGPGTGSGSTAPTTAPPAPFRTVTDVADKTNDEGLQGKSYADIVGLKMEDNGTRARVTVSMAADIPATPPSDETISVPIDFFRGGKESDFQLFAQWNGADWRAYYTAGTTQKQFPGTFELGSNKLVFDVPWSSLGGRVAGTVSAEADWSKQGTVVAPASEDHIPDTGSSPFAP